MREIKFRAWVSKAKLMLRVTDIDFEDKSIGCKDNATQWNDYEYLIMQYTGLKDKNGVEIYEGDVVTLRGQAQGTNKGVVIFSPSATKFAVRVRRNGYRKNETHLVSLLKCKVIGNTHENPELMKE